MSDGMFPKSVGFMSCIHLGKRPTKSFGKGRSIQKHLKGAWMNPLCITFKGEPAENSTGPPVGARGSIWHAPSPCGELQCATAFN